MYGPGCGVGVEAGVGVGRSRPFWSESESELVSGKFRCALGSAVVDYILSMYDNFDRRIIHSPEHIGIYVTGEETSEAKRVNSFTAWEFRLIRGIYQQQLPVRRLLGGERAGANRCA